MGKELTQKTKLDTEMIAEKFQNPREKWTSTHEAFINLSGYNQRRTFLPHITARHQKQNARNNTVSCKGMSPRL